MGNNQGNDKPKKSPLSSPAMRNSSRLKASNAKIGAQLKQVPILSQYTSKELNILGGAMKEKTFKDGEKIIEQGEIGKGFFIISEGRAIVTRTDDDSKDPSTLGELKSGDYFGELALLENQVRGATVTAKNVVKCFYLGQKEFQDLFVSVDSCFQVKFAKRAGVTTGRQQQLTDNPKPKESISSKNEEQINFIHKAIEKNVLFSGYNKCQLIEIINQMQKVDIKEGRTVITEGTRGEKFYVIENGAFDITQNGQKLCERKTGETFGELALMYHSLRAATVTATKDSVVWVTERQDFRRLLTTINERDHGQYAKFLNTVDLLKPLASYERQKLAHALEDINFPDKHVIFNQGDPGDVMYLVRKGEVSITVDGKVVTNLKEGEYFGERALLKHDKRAGTATAVGDCDCLYLNQECFAQLLGPLDEILEKRQSGYGLEEKKDALSSSTKQGKLDNKIKFENLKILGTLGKGSFGYVQLVQDRVSKETFALKAVNKSIIVETGQEGHIMNEKNVMAMLKHPFIIRLHQTFKDRERLYFLIEPVLGGELFSLLRALTLFDTATATFYAACVVSAFEYMHSLDVIHRDLKPENLLLDSEGYCILTDFGFAKVMTAPRTTTLCGTPDYLAPEIITGKGHGKGVDWWTVGILIFEMLASTPPFFDEDPLKIYQKIVAGDIIYPSHFRKSAISIVKKLLKHKPTKRLGVVKGGAKKIKEHPWFADLDWKKLYQRKLTAPIVLQIKDNTDLSNFDDVQDELPDPITVYKETTQGWDADF